MPEPQHKPPVSGSWQVGPWHQVSLLPSSQPRMERPCLCPHILRSWPLSILCLPTSHHPICPWEFYTKTEYAPCTSGYRALPSSLPLPHFHLPSLEIPFGAYQHSVPHWHTLTPVPRYSEGFYRCVSRLPQDCSPSFSNKLFLRAPLHILVNTWGDPSGVSGLPWGKWPSNYTPQCLMKWPEGFKPKNHMLAFFPQMAEEKWIRWQNFFNFMIIVSLNLWCLLLLACSRVN